MSSEVDPEAVQGVRSNPSPPPVLNADENEISWSQ